jgi:HD superfamily phosphohydrolase
MEYRDRVYGKFEIEEPVMLELIAAPELQRLRGIDQAGYGPFWMEEYGIPEETYEHSRFSHSVGVMLLLKRYGASLEEQVAGLIHDVSHTAFSHCTEYALSGGNGGGQDSQDRSHERFVRGSYIPAILEKFGLDLDHILDDKNFPLKETSLPDLCADRIDYVLRDAIVYKQSDEDGVRYLLDNLRAEDGIWSFASLESAERFAELFFRMNNECYAGIVSARMFCAVGDFVKHALEKGYISLEDLEGEDESVVKKAMMNSGGDKGLEILFARMENRVVGFDDPQKGGRHIVCKSRAVDSLFSDEGRLRRLSDAKPEWKEIMMAEKKPKEYYVKFEE